MASRSRSYQPIDIVYLRALRTEAEALYRDQDAQIDTMRGMRELTFKVDVGNAKVCDVEHRDATIADELQRVSAMFTVNPAKARVRHSKVGKSADENTTQREHFLEAVLDEAGGREFGPTTLERAVDAAVADGGAWTKFLHVKDYWDRNYARSISDYEDDPEDTPNGQTAAQKYDAATEDDKRGAGVPFDWIACDSRCVYPFFRGRKLAEVLEVQERPVSTTFRQYRLGVNASDEIVPEELGDPDWRSRWAGVTTVTWVEHWTEDTVTYAVLGGPNKAAHVLKGYPRKHRYKRVPYFAALPLVHSHWRNRKVGWSVSEPKRYLVELLSFYRTLLAQNAVFQARPTMFRTAPADAVPAMGDSGEGRQQVPTEQVYEGGRIYTLQPGEKVEIPAYPAIADSLRAEIEGTRRDIEKMEPPRFQDTPEGGAGWGIAQVLAENKTRHHPIAAAVERMLVELSGFVEYLVVNVVGETVYAFRGDDKQAGWVSAGPETFKDPVKTEWELSPETPSSRIMDERYAAARVTNGSWGVKEMVEFLGDNFDEILESRALDEIRSTDWYKSALHAAVLAKIGRGELLKMQQQAEQVAQSGMVPPQPAEVMPGGGVPDTGALAQAPGGQGANPVGVPSAGGYGPNAGGQAQLAQAVGT
jgi:hypothetical protein